MKHNWYEDVDYKQNDTHYKKELCVNCDAVMFYWSDIRNGKIISGQYVMEGNTQYSHVLHTCNCKYIKTTLF